MVAEEEVVALAEHYLRTRMHYANVTDVKLIYEKSLTDSDVNRNQSRLAMSRNKVLTPFLTHSEDLFLQWKTADGANTKIPLNVVVGSTEYKLTLSRWNYHDTTTTPSNKKNNKKQEDDDENKKNIIDGSSGDTKNKEDDDTTPPSNKKRKRTNNKKQDDDNKNKKKKSCYRWKYVLNGGWKQLKEDNRLQSGQPIQVVSFRSNHNHYIGLLLLPGHPPT